MPWRPAAEKSDLIVQMGRNVFFHKWLVLSQAEDHELFLGSPLCNKFENSRG